MERQMIKERSNNWTVAYLIHTEISYSIWRRYMNQYARYTGGPFLLKRSFNTCMYNELFEKL